MIDEWFNLYLYSGSIESIQYSILDTGHKSWNLRIQRSWKLKAKESRHESRAESEVREPGVLTQSWAESRRLRTRITPNQFQVTYWRRISSWTDIFIINLYQINQDKLCVFVTYGPDPDFSNHFFKSKIR
jgi:hypothetical protein